MIRVLFLCTGNSARSQMAEGLLRHLGGPGFDVVSAGTHPAGLNPLSVEAMAEVGIDISHHRSKLVDEFLDQRFDYVITVCDRANEECPIFPGDVERIHWGFDDPAAVAGTHDDRIKSFRRVRDEITMRLRTWLELKKVHHLASTPA